MAQFKKTIAQYLEKYAEPEVQLFHAALTAYQFQNSNRLPKFTHVLAIPAYREPPDFIQHYQNVIQTNDGDMHLLMVLVINQPDSISGIEPQNQHLLAWIQDKEGQIFFADEHLQLKQLDPKFSLLIVNRCSNPIPFKQGVGLARKIALDLCCFLYAEGYLSSPWVGNTDADSRPCGAYFANLNQATFHFSAQIFQFKHRSHGASSQAVIEATQLYEDSLHHYVNGLTRAGSDYAFHTIGSILAINLSDYAKVRGYPKRAAGEDFYLLNKLRKLAPFHFPQSLTVDIEARHSDRVPFGTGPMVNKLIEHGKDYPLFYHPQCFELLALLLNGMETWIQSEYWKGTETQARQALEMVLLKDIQTSNFSSTEAAEIQDVCLTGLDFLKIQEFIRHCCTQLKTTEQVKHQWLVWFDGFKTLKWIHYLRDQEYPAMSQTALKAWYDNSMVLDSVHDTLKSK